MDAQAEVMSEREQRINDVLGAYLEFADAGCAPDRRELIARYPEYADDLEFFFTAQDRVSALAGTQPYPSAIDDEPVGDYENLVWIGKKGGMGIVFKAWHRGMKHWVALKKIKAGRLASTVEVRRFRAEIEAAATLDHPHIVPIYDVREHRGLPCYSMKLFEHGSLEDHLPRFIENPRASAKLLATVARAVHFAHQHGILHRDLKPANILLDADDQPHVTDFGLAKRFRPELSSIRGPAPVEAKIATPDTATPSEKNVSSVPDENAAVFLGSEQLSGSAGPTVTMDHADGLTAMGAFIGTFGYVPPEHAYVQGDTSTVADVYSLGAILYKLLTGKTTFKAKDADDAIRQLRDCDPPTPRSLNPAIDPRLEAICLKCLQKDPQNRYASAEALAEDLDRWLKGEPPLAWPMPWRLRAWRAVRRNLVTVVASSLLSVAGAVIFLVYYYFDPDRIPRQIEREARQGRVTLIGDTGPPRWWRWNVGEGTAMVAADKDQAFSFTTVEHGRIELLRSAPGPRYRFSAEVRHERALNFAGYAGIYVGHTRRETKDDVERYWCDLTFADQGGLATGEAGPGPERKYALVEFKLALHSLPTRFTTRKTGVQQPFLSAGEMKEASGWRKLAIEVTPEKVRTFWEGQPPQELSLAELRQLCKSKISGGEVKAPQFEFDFDGGLGLFIFQGKAFFRRVTIEPLN